MDAKVRVLVIGCGLMGGAHARAYAAVDGFELVGLVNRGAGKRESLSVELGGVPHFGDVAEALAASAPDAVSICTYTETHYLLARQCLEAGLHVFIEKPLAATVDEAEELVELARARGRTLVVGYILRHHPTWMRFVELGQSLGAPLVMRMNLNQQSFGQTWSAHKGILKSTSPLVDVGVHYIDVMCQMTRSRPVSVYASGVCQSDEVEGGMFNYGVLQVRFEDGSVGWFESGFGPMISQTAHFVKDVFGPKGSVSILGVHEQSPEAGASSAREGHTGTAGIRVHHAELDAEGNFARPDEWIRTEAEPGHLELCEREQRFFLQAVQGNVDLTEHWESAVESLRVTLAAEQSARTGEVVILAGRGEIAAAELGK